jgi:hypothetical protein
MKRGVIMVVFVMLAACGEDSSGGPYIPIQMFDSAFHDAQCKHAVACGEFPDQATCLKYSLTGTTGIFSSPQIEAAVLAGKIYFDGARFASCVAFLAAETCDLTDADGRDPPPEICKRLFRGTVAAGGACAFDGECTSEVCNLACGQGTCCQGTCVGDTPPAPEVLSSIGQSCQVNGCVAKSFCNPSKICTALKTASMACTSPGECDYGLDCIGTPTTTCRALPTLAQACPDGLCRDEGLHCTGGACLEVGLPGATCAVNSDCSPYFRCDAGVTNRCIAYPAVGESCAQTFQCADSATVYCSQLSNMCTAVKAVGDACMNGIECGSGFCDLTTHLCADDASCI